MQDLSLHILDLAENSLAAGASTIRIKLEIDGRKDLLAVSIEDDGPGMDEETLSRALNPFFTTRKTRKVGLGLPLFREAARAAGGDLTIRSQPGRGVKLKAWFRLSHPDCKPIGDLAGTLLTLVIGNPQVRFLFTLHRDGLVRRFDSERVINRQAGIAAMAAAARKKLARMV